MTNPTFLVPQVFFFLLHYKHYLATTTSTHLLKIPECRPKTKARKTLTLSYSVSLMPRRSFLLSLKKLLVNELLYYYTNSADKIFEAVTKCFIKNRVIFAQLAQQETGMGSFEDKVTKNLCTAEGTYYQYKGKIYDLLSKN